MGKKTEGCTTKCGDGVHAGVEACDDGGTEDGDGCSADCKTLENGYKCNTKIGKKTT